MNVKVVQKGLDIFLENTKNYEKFSAAQKRVVKEGFDLLEDELKKKEECQVKNIMDYLEKGFKDLVKSRDCNSSTDINFSEPEEKSSDDDDEDDDDVVGPKKRKWKNWTLVAKVKSKCCYLLPVNQVMPLHPFDFHGCECTDYGCYYHTTSVWFARGQYRPAPFTGTDRGHVQAYLIIMYENALKINTRITQETTFKKYCQMVLPKRFYEWLYAEGIWEGDDKSGSYTLASKQRMHILNAPINCGGRCQLCYYVRSKRGDKAESDCCTYGGLHLNQAISVTQGEEGHNFLRDLACKRVELQAIVIKKKLTTMGTPRPGVHPKLYYLDVEDANVLAWQNANSPPLYPDYVEDSKAKTETVVTFARNVKNFKESVVQSSTS